MSKKSIAAIILAAGASRRMGQPKQLLPYREQTLLGHVIECALTASCIPVIVILGKDAQKIEPEIEHFPITIVKNLEWNQGMSCSIRCGVEYIEEQNLNIKGMVFLACDQPFISADTIEQLIELYHTSNQPIVASQYGKTVGIPVLFARSLCSELAELKGDRGARKVIQKYRNQVATINFSEGLIDLDNVSSG